MSVEDNKRLVACAIAEVINGGDLDAVEQLYAPGIAQAAREWAAVPRGASRCADADRRPGGGGRGRRRPLLLLGTHTGPSMGRPGTGRSFSDVREVYSFTVRGGRIVDWWGLEDNDDPRRQLRDPSRTP